MLLEEKDGRGNEGNSQERLWMIPIEWGKNKSERNNILKMLYDMNISQATLFPDLSGFAKSLWTRIAHPESLGVKLK